ncbi:MAG: penicillin-binding protein 2 [Thermomicrobiales bacterium]|nr:penicillin-binding protein 2 [Thermomicrobiales bacterium]
MARHRPLTFNQRSGPPPILLGLIGALVIAVAVVGLLRGGYLSAGWLPAGPERLPWDAPDPRSAALATPDPESGATSPTDETVAAAAPDGRPAAASPAPAPVPPPDEIAAAWLRAWTAADYDALYDLLGGRAQRAIDRAAFAERYRAIAERAGLERIAARVAGAPAPDGDVPFSVAFTSSLVGDFSQQNLLPMVREPDGWKVDWVPGAIFAELGADRCLDVDAEPTRRGSILDRRGEPLAYDGAVQRVGVVPGQIPADDEARVLKTLGDLTGLPEDDLRARYADADPSWFVPIMDFPDSRSEELLNAVGPLPGASVRPARARIYPMGAAAAHITGYISEVTAEQLAADPTLRPGQIIGQAGIEAGADDLLAGQDGERLVAVECESRAEMATIAERPPVAPHDVVLTIDRDLQQATVAALSAQGDARGAAVALDPESGAVLALASLPSYDPNGFILGFSTKDRALIQSELRRPLLDRVAEAAYPTGSIFKAITFAAAMEDLGYTGDTWLDCPQYFQIEGTTQRWDDWTVEEGLGPQGPMTLHRALVNSCNTVFYAIGRDLDRLDPDLLPQMTRGFGLGAPTGIPFFPEIAGIVPDPAWKLATQGDGWATGDAVNLAIGQGYLEATPLQMAVAYAAIANGGDLLRPYLVAASIAPDGVQQSLGGRTTRGRLPVAATTIAALQSALHDQTSDWTGAGSVRVFGDFPWPIAGKTGTAQNQLTPGKKPHAWFAGYAPWGGQPTIASAVMIESVGEGVSYAAPVTRSMYEAWLSRPPEPAPAPAG